MLQQEPVDDIEDEEVDELHLPTTSAPSNSKASRLDKPKEKPRESQLEYQQSLPYEAESLEVMDGRLEEIVRRLVDCVRAKD